jgi:hypothetical protein
MNFCKTASIIELNRKNKLNRTGTKFCNILRTSGYLKPIRKILENLTDSGFYFPIENRSGFLKKIMKFETFRIGNEEKQFTGLKKMIFGSGSI